MSESDIVTLDIAVTSSGPARTGFGTPLLAVFHQLWGVTSGERVRSYTGLAGMVADGFTARDPAYQMAAIIFSQRPRVRRVKVGRCALPATQVIDLTPGAPAEGLVYGATINGTVVTYTALVSDDLAAVCTALATALNVANGADADAIIATGGASTGGSQTYDGAELNGVLGGTTFAPPRAVTLTFSSHADWDATNATVTGTNAAGQTITATLAIPNGGNATVTSTVLFKTVTSIAIPAQSGTGGTFTAGVASRFTAVGSSGTKVVVTTRTAGTLQSYADLSPTLSVKDATTDPGIATDLTAIQAADGDWYGLALDANAEAVTDAAAAALEALGKKVFAAQTADTLAMSSGSTTDVLADLVAASYGLTAPHFHPSIATSTSWLAAGMLGNRLPADPGSDTWAFKTVPGVAVYSLTDTQKANLLAKKCTVYTVVDGYSITQGGKVASGEWTDVVRGLHWFETRTRERVLALLVANNGKIPYTDSGIGLVVAEITAQINDAIRVGLAADAPKPTAAAPLVADIDAATRATRELPDVEFTFRLAGAIHAVGVRGTVTS